MRARLFPVILAPAVLILSACAGGGPYPSLARRPAERITASALPVAAAPAPAPKPLAVDLGARIGQLPARAAAADAAFRSLTPGDSAAIIDGLRQPPGSAEWSRATTRLGSLESARAQTSGALAELDAAYGDDRIAHADADADAAAPPRPARSALEAARAAITALLAGEDAVLEKLSAP